MIEKVEYTFWARIFISGPIEVAEQIIREDCSHGRLCVTIEPVKFIYKGGEEMGYEVGLVNYPKYPESQEYIKERAITLAKSLIEKTYQDSALIETPTYTIWITKRK